MFVCFFICSLQGVPLDIGNLPMEPPPPYPLYQQSQQTMQQQQQQSTQSHPPNLQQRQPQGGQQPVSPLQNVPLDFNSSAVSSSFLTAKERGVTEYPYFCLIFINLIALLI